MTDTIEQILEHPNGAKFFRADLHIHSFEASHDVRDQSMTPENIVETAISEGLSIIAVTDHNEIGNVDLTLRAAEGRPITVIPGIELSTPQGHLLLYCQTIAALRRLNGTAEG
jgi:predicted metal-dependent phosphoesterase TrpH